MIKTTPLITFKENDDETFWETEGFLLARDSNGNQIHLGNNAGLDLFKGKSLIIAGKYDMPQSYYQEIWDDIGDGSLLTQQNK